MGLFKKKKKTYVNTSITRMIEDKDIPNMGQNAAMEYVLQNQAISTRVDHKSLVDCFNDQVTSSLSAKMRSARNYAKSGKYSYGIPKPQLVLRDGVDVVTEVQEYLQASLGKPVAIKYAIFGPVNNLHFLRKMLVEDYGYNPVTNELTLLSDSVSKAYLQDAQIVYCADTIQGISDPDSFYQHGESTTSGKTDFRTQDLKRKHTDWSEDVYAPHDYAVVYVSKKAANGSEVVTTFNLDFLQYEHSGPPPEDGLDDSNTGDIDPDRDQIGDVIDTGESADYFMAFYEYEDSGVVKKEYFTYEYGSGGIPKLDNLFTVQTELGQYLPNIYARLNGRKLNKDQYKDTQEYKSSRQLCRRLDLDYDNWVEEIHKQIGSLQYVKQILMTSAIQVNKDNDPLSLEYIYEYFMEMYNKMPNNFADTSYTSLKTAYALGAAKMGQTVNIRDKVYHQQLSFNALGYQDIEGNVGEIGSITKGYDTITVRTQWGFYTHTSKISVHKFRKQITANLYREIQIYGLTSTQYVEGGYTTTANNRDDNLLIPFDIALLDKFNLQQRDRLYAKSLLIMLHTVQIVKQKWYETGIFKGIMFVIAVIVSVYTNGSGMVLYAILYAVVQAVVISILIQALAKLLVKVGINVGVVFAVIAVIAIIYGGYISLRDVVGVASVTAPQMLQIASIAFQVSNAGQQIQMMNMQKAYTEYMDILDKKANDLQEQITNLGLALDSKLEALISPPSHIDIRLGEFGADYIDRVKSVVDISKAVILLPENYVDIAISKPTFQDFIRNLNSEDQLYDLS